MMFCYPLMLHIQYYFPLIRLVLPFETIGPRSSDNRISPVHYSEHSTVSVATVFDPSIVEGFYLLAECLQPWDPVGREWM